MQTSLVENLFWVLNHERNPKYFDISEIYRRIFSIYNKKELNYLLEDFYENVYLEYKEDDYWFERFHKMIRQTDFFNDCYRHDGNEYVSINGDLDMLLHTFIYIDENYLLTTLKFIFQEHEENK